jgi:hypothetical protein
MGQIFTESEINEVEMIADRAEVAENDPSLRGQLASEPILFHWVAGEGHFAVFAIHTRFDEVSWLVSSPRDLDEFGLPEIIGQGRTPGEALGCLPVDRA